MSQIAASTGQKGLSIWIQRAKTAATWAAFAAAGFIVGAYIFAPGQQRAQPSYLPPAYLNLATATVSLQSADGPGAILPVRIADNSSSRLVGFRDVGEDALANQFLLYAQSRQTTTRVSYNLENVRVPLELAAFDAEGNFVAMLTTSPGETRISVAEPHRWLLAAKAGTFTHYGIGEGMSLDPESVRKINL